jgi:hypothetical protein
MEKKKKRKKKLSSIPGSETSAKRRGTNSLGNMPSRYTTYSQVSGLFVYGPSARPQALPLLACREVLSNTKN